jgi:hypothetical protein
MRYNAIRSHLQPYIIVARRKTTINHAFAAAIAPNDSFDEARVREAVSYLGQDPDADLRCAYCGAEAQTWDHVYATVKDSRFSGYGHRLGNLLPCCKPCNSSKGNRDWRSFLDGLAVPSDQRRIAVERIELYLSKLACLDDLPASSPEFERFLQVRAEVLALLEEADQLAKIVREQQHSRLSDAEDDPSNQ